MEENKRKEILSEALKCVNGQREQDYGSPENNFGCIANFWTIYMDGQVVFTPVDVAMMMALLKLARIKSGKGTKDSFVDLAGYAACGGELQDIENQKNDNRPVEVGLVRKGAGYGKEKTRK